MSGGFGRAALWGVGFALAALVIGGVLLAANVIVLPDPNAPVARYLVIAVAPDDEGAEVAVIALAVDSATQSIEVLDTSRESALAGTSARNARDAYPFGGGGAVAEALASQTGGEALEWVSLPAETWAKLIDANGGMKTSVERGISAYVEGQLTVVEPGERTLSGREAVALAVSSEFIESERERQDLATVLGDTLASALSTGESSIRELVASQEAHASVEAERLPSGF